MPEKTYIAIDLKSFYASVECVARGLDPLSTNLVVADLSRTEKTICLAVSPTLKQLGISGRARMFEVIEQVKVANGDRRARAGRLEGSSSDAFELAEHPALAIDYIVAPPRMARYVEISTQIYSIYLRHVAPEDIHVYSIDEVFIDVTGYLRIQRTTPHEFAMKLIREVLAETGITATAGIGSNLYLAKVAMDIVAKHVPADADGVRIAELNERTYRERLWGHVPITDFWRIGRGYARRLAQAGASTMGEVARLSMTERGQNILYKMFGVNAELLIDHAWGIEPVEMSHIKAYRPKSNSLGSGQVLDRPYGFEEARLVMSEMADQLACDLLSKGLESDQLVFTVGYDIENVTVGTGGGKRSGRRNGTVGGKHSGTGDGAKGAPGGSGGGYTGELSRDAYGRLVPKHAHATVNLGLYCASSKLFRSRLLPSFDDTVDASLLVRRLNLTACHVRPIGSAANVEDEQEEALQLDLFCDEVSLETDDGEWGTDDELERERRIQQAIVKARQRFGNSAVLKGMDLFDGATRIDRNTKLGGHRA